MDSNLDLLWKLYIIYIYLPHIVGALLTLYALNVLTRIALHKLFKLRLPKWWQGDTLIPLVIAASCVLVVIAGGYLLAQGRYDWDHQYTAESREEAKSLSFDVYMPTYIPGIQKIFDQSIATSQKGQKFLYTLYGNESYDSGVEVTEFNDAQNKSSDICTPIEPDNDAFKSYECNFYAETNMGKIYMNEGGEAFGIIGNTRIVLQNVERIDQKANPRTSEYVKSEVVKLFNSLQKVDPTKLEYVDRNTMHAAD